MLRFTHGLRVTQSTSTSPALPTDHDAVIVAESRDGGRTFTNREVAYDFDFPFNPDTRRDTLTGENFRINSFPQLTIDPVTDALYATWSDDRNGLYDATTGASIKTNGDVFIVASRDGRHWSRTYGVGTGADEVYPAIAAYGGRVAVSFYTRVYDQRLNRLVKPAAAPSAAARLAPRHANQAHQARRQWWLTRWAPIRYHRFETRTRVRSPTSAAPF